MTADLPNGNAAFAVEKGFCESCDESTMVVRFNVDGVGLKFAACAVCLNAAYRLVRGTAEPEAKATRTCARCGGAYGRNLMCECGAPKAKATEPDCSPTMTDLMITPEAIAKFCVTCRGTGRVAYDYLDPRTTECPDCNGDR